MSNAVTLTASGFDWRAYLALCKLKVVSLIVFTAIVGMLLSTEGAIPLSLLVLGSLGIGLGAACGAAINHIVDQRIDSVMQRTVNRPLPQQQISALQALIFAIGLGIASMLILGFLVNWLTAFLTLASMVGYAVIYTMYLKRNTPHNIVLGGAAGAAPPILGWAAITGEVTVDAFLLFLIIFVWTPPHFWPLAIKRREEYKRAGLPMLPVTHGVAFTKQQILIYSFLLLSVTVMPYVTGMSGLLYLVGAMLLNAGFISHAIKLFCQDGDDNAMPMFGFSIFYLAALFLLLLVDHYSALYWMV